MQQKSVSSLFMALLCLGLLVLYGGNVSGAEGKSDYNGPKVVFKVAQGAASNGHSGIALTNFKNRMEARCGGKVEVQVYSDSLLGTEREITEGVILGTVEMIAMGMGTFGTFYEKMQFANTPFLLSSREQSWKFYDSEFMRKLNEEVGKALGLRVFGYGENGLRCLSNNARVIKTPADMAGLKIRVQPNPMYIAMIQALGASPTPIAFAELYTSLQQKTVDGQDNGIPLTVNNRFYEVQPFFSTLNHCYDQLIWLANEEWFSGLDPVLQKIIQEEVDNWKADIRNLAAEFDILGIETMAKAGVTITYLSDAERQAFKDKMGPVYDIARGIVGADFFNSVLEAAEQAK
jgi:C4-dicarboxylate-binding protein DctP